MVLLLDGGTGHELKLRTAASSFHEAMLLNTRSRPLVEAVHRAFLCAGCAAITTNNFTLTRAALAAAQPPSATASPAPAHPNPSSPSSPPSSPSSSSSSSRSPSPSSPSSPSPSSPSIPSLGASTRAAAAAARAAASSASPSALVFGCLPPLGPRCYDPAGVPLSLRRLTREYTQIASHLLAGGPPDALLAETLSTSREALGAAAAAAAVGLPLYVCFTIGDTPASPLAPPRLRGGELLEAAVEALLAAEAAPSVVGVGVNCAAPRAVGAALPFARRAAAGRVPLVAYANGFRTTTSEWLRRGEAGEAEDEGEAENDPAEYDEEGMILPQAYARHVEEWVAGGAEVVGGCCGCSPRVMEAVARALAARQAGAEER
ncbi:hypothetical protein AB1Y20_014796 [Prymnesium parvum]|uniref:Hcy-binding domain-containing protein n=1 Tax=Prymnesium parvum TaxID=97485 RepID=A0AB34IBY4_PRYPA